MQYPHIQFYSLLLIVALVCCTPDNGADESNLELEFHYEPETVYVGEEISFITESEGLSEDAEYSWDFGDGSTSTLKNPVHTYTDIGDGEFTALLTVSDKGAIRNFSKKIIPNYSNEITGRETLIQKLEEDEILTCAHRGYHENNPENSLAAINDAIEEGIEIVEIDIRQSKDGHLVLVHDETLDRTTNGTGLVNNFTLAELLEFNLKNSNGILTNQKITTLKEALAEGRGRVYYDLDISKKVNFEAVYPLVKQYGMLKQVFFYSSELDVIRKMLNKDSDVLAMPAIDGTERFEDYQDLNNIKIVHYDQDSFNINLVERAKDKGWFILMNAYVNSDMHPTDDNYAKIDNIIGLKGNIVQTDVPVLVKNYINN